jgi:hypothetical protein
MKSRIQYFTIIVVLMTFFGILLFTIYRQSQESAQAFPATINRDCAPWDGAAFTISMQYDSVSVITISIWQSPDIKFPSTFSLPDEAGQVGYAYILSELGPLIPLNGEVSFQRVSEGTPVEGRFSLKSERGEAFDGKFMAEWESQIVYCG